VTIRVLIADDHDLIRHGFSMILDAQPDLQGVGEVADGEAALTAARRLFPDVVLADIRMPKLDGIEVLKRLNNSTASDPPKVIVVTTFDDDVYVRAALDSGAAGFVLKRSGPTLLVEAIRAAAAGDAAVRT
jgi:DNA-binding NarL/FixJ family response regulator